MHLDSKGHRQERLFTARPGTRRHSGKGERQRPFGDPRFDADPGRVGASRTHRLCGPRPRCRRAFTAGRDAHRRAGRPTDLHTARGTIRTGSCFAPARTPQRVVATEGWILTLSVDPSSAPATMIEDEMTAATSLFGLSHRRERELVELCRAPIVDQIAANLGLSTWPLPAPVHPALRHHIPWLPALEPRDLGGHERHHRPRPHPLGHRCRLRPPPPTSANPSARWSASPPPRCSTRASTSTSAPRPFRQGRCEGEPTSAQSRSAMVGRVCLSSERDDLEH